MTPPAAPLLATCAAVAAMLPASVLLGTWAASTGGATRATALGTTAVLLAGLHLLVARVGRRRLSPQLLSVAALTGAVVLASFALALGLSALSLNPVLYELSRGDVLLAALVVAATSALLIGHAAAAARASRGLPRNRRSVRLGE